MASFNLKSTIISNRDASPKVLTDAFVSGGEVRESEGFVQTGSAADAVGSTYRLCQVPSNARVTSLVLQNDALGAGAVVNIGVYYPTTVPVGAGLSSALAGTAINASAFAAAVSVAAVGAATEVVTRANVAINLQEQALWQLAGLTSDPLIYLDIVITVSVITAAQGYVSLKAKYIE